MGLPTFGLLACTIARTCLLVLQRYAFFFGIRFLWGIFFLLPHLFLYPLLQMGLCWSFEPDTHVRSAVVVELNVDFSERAG